ncbi:MAG: enoyl-CoA hydratase-related protein [Pseudomonadota bacterium]
MAYETILYDIDDHVATITLNRPQALNALSTQLLGEVAEAMAVADSDRNTRVIILTGSEKAFAAGADIAEMAAKDFTNMYLEDLFAREVAAIMAVKKPILAAVSGYALGGGCELAMICDTIYCAENAKFGQPEINLGVIAGIGGSQRLTRFVGKAKSMDMHLTGRFMDAVEAERSGLVSRVFPTDKLLKEVKAIAGKLAEKSILATTAAKDAVNRSYETTLSEGLLYEKRLFHSLFSTQDQAEGMEAFLAKREPRFRDK